MHMKKYLFLSLFAVSIVNANNICPLESDCATNNSCECYCSRKCNYRKKEADDVTVYVKNDPAGHYCYCKQWDLDNYQSLCSLK